MTSEVPNPWFVYGVGETGCEYIDAALRRAQTLREKNSIRASVWDDAVGGVVVDTSRERALRESYFAYEFRADSSVDVANRHRIGPACMLDGGADVRAGERLAEWTLKQTQTPFKGDDWAPSLTLNRIRDSLAALFLHDLDSRMGAGATPTILQNINTQLNLSNHRITLFSGASLPSRDSVDDLRISNCLCGLSRSANITNAIILFDNNRLRAADENTQAQILDFKKYPAVEGRIKRRIAFIELLMLSSQPAQFDARTHGQTLDPIDICRPAEAVLPADVPEVDALATIIAPALGYVETEDREFNEDRLRRLVYETLYEDRLVEFDPTTAWGGSFVFLLPEDHEEDITQTINEVAIDVIQDEEMLAMDSDDTLPNPIHTYMLTVPDLESLRLLALLWNPKVRRLEDWKTWANDVRESNADHAIMKQLRENWEEIESLFSFLGRGRAKQQLE